MQGQPKGSLKINAPMTLGITDLGAAFAAFTAQHPEVELDVDLSDEPVDLITQGYDIGFRASSSFIDVNYVGKPIATFNLHLVTTPKYLKANGPINSPDQLSIIFISIAWLSVKINCQLMVVLWSRAISRQIIRSFCEKPYYKEVVLGFFPVLCVPKRLNLVI